MTGDVPTALDEATRICTAAADQGITVRLAGGLAIQYLTPEFPPRGGDRQDLDLATQSSDRKQLTSFLTGRGYVKKKQQQGEPVAVTPIRPDRHLWRHIRTPILYSRPRAMPSNYIVFLRNGGGL